MPVFFQHQINDTTRLGVWKIEEPEAFFLNQVPLHRAVTHPHKRLQHLTGRFLLRFLVPGFPYELIRVADTRRPFLANEAYHFSISHCGDYAAAIVSSSSRVGIDIEQVKPLVGKLIPKFLSPEEIKFLRPEQELQQATLLWSAKEAVFKWYGDGLVDFREHIRLQQPDEATGIIPGYFTKTGTLLQIHFRQFDKLALAWILSA